MKALITERSELVKIVYSCFIRVLKTKGRYLDAMCIIGSKYPSSCIVHVLCRKSKHYEKLFANNIYSPLSSAKSIRQVYTLLSHRDLRVDPTRFTTDQELQMFIEDRINFLIHHTIELTTYEMNILGKIGKETFDLACRKVYGGDFEDVTRKYSEDAEKLNSMIMQDSPTNITDEIKELLLRISNEAIVYRSRSDCDQYSNALTTAASAIAPTVWVGPRYYLNNGDNGAFPF